MAENQKRDAHVSGAATISYKIEEDYYRDIRLLPNGDLEVVCTRRSRFNQDIMVLCHGTTKRDLDALIYAIERMKPFVPEK